LAARRTDPETQLSTVSEEIPDCAVETGEVPQDIEYECTLSVLSCLHHLSDRSLTFSNKVPLSDSEYVEKDIVYLSLALQLVAERRLLLLLRELGEPPDILGVNLIRDYSKAFQSPLVLGCQLKASIKDPRSSINIIRAKPEVVPAYGLKGERYKTVMRGFDDARPLLRAYLTNLIEISKPNQGKYSPRKAHER
jgi:hypothetical protein